MKRKLLVLLFFMVSGLLVKGQDLSSVQSTVSAAVEKLRLAMISGNKANLEEVLSSELVYGHSSGKIQTRAEFVEEISSKKSDFLKINLLKQSIAVLENTAVVKHILVADTNDGGKPAHIFLGVVLVWRLEKGVWKLISRSAFHIPPEDIP